MRSSDQRKYLVGPSLLPECWWIEESQTVVTGSDTCGRSVLFHLIFGLVLFFSKSVVIVEVEVYSGNVLVSVKFLRS